LVNNKILARSLLILSSLALILEGCYLFCLFRPENAFEEMLEQFVEEEMGVKLSEDESLEKFSPVDEEL
jgi:hypothetical protein